MDIMITSRFIGKEKSDCPNYIQSNWFDEFTNSDVIAVELQARWTISSIITADVSFLCTLKSSVAVEEGRKKMETPGDPTPCRPPVAPESQVKYDPASSRRVRRVKSISFFSRVPRNSFEVHRRGK
jgi:hypothetical protein